MFGFFLANKMALVCLILVALGALPVQLSVRLYRKTNLIRVNTLLKLWLLPLKIEMVNPLTKAVWKLSVNRPWGKPAPHELRGAEVSWLRFFKRTSNFRRLGGKIIGAANKFLNRIGRSIKVIKLDLYTEIGLEDAARTAVASGLAWWVMSLIINRFAAYFDMSRVKPCLNVRPDFQKEGHLLIDYSCIFEFRLGHIIIIVYHMLRNAVAISREIRRISI